MNTTSSFITVDDSLKENQQIDNHKLNGTLVLMTNDAGDAKEWQVI